MALYAGTAVTVIILLINTVLKQITISLITWVKYDTFSKQLTSITNGIFIAQFFNTAILILIVNAAAGGKRDSVYNLLF